MEIHQVKAKDKGEYWRPTNGPKQSSIRQNIQQQRKANIIADFFTKVFTNEQEADDEEVTTLENRHIENPLDKLEISEERIEKILSNL